MNNLTNFNYQGKSIQQREDGYINLSQMCQATGKRVNDFIRLKTTKEYLEELSEATTITVGLLVDIQNGKETWGHRLLAIRCSQWISPKFAVWCDAHIFNLMETGQTSLEIDPIEELKLKVELAKYEAQKETAIAQSQSLRYTITQTCPEHIQQRVLGCTEVKTVEYRDRIVKEDELINDGSTVNKTWLCKRLGFMKNGRPDTKKLNAYLAEMPSEAFQLSAYIRENQEFKREYLPMLEDLIENERQINLGE
jgi:hypothetical protein